MGKVIVPKYSVHCYSRLQDIDQLMESLHGKIRRGVEGWGSALLTVAHSVISHFCSLRLVVVICDSAGCNLGIFFGRLACGM